MRCKIEIIYEGDFSEEDIRSEVERVSDEIIDSCNNEFSEPKFDTFGVYGYVAEKDKKSKTKWRKV